MTYSQNPGAMERGQLHRALARGDDAETRRLVCGMLDGGRGRELRRALQDAEIRGFEDHLDSVLWTECQSYSQDAVHSALFCLPCTLSAQAPNPPAAALAGPLGALCVSGEAVVVADAWFSLDDLRSMDPVRMRRVSRELGRAACSTAAAGQEARVCKPPRSCLPSGVARPLVSYVRGAPPLAVLPQFVLGAVARSACQAGAPQADLRGAFHNLTSGHADDSVLQALASAMEAVAGEGCSVQVPSMPLEAASSALGMLHGAALESRLHAALMQLGHQPQGHYAIGAGEIMVVLSSRAGRAVDAISMPLGAVAAEFVEMSLYAGCSGLVRHDVAATLPQMERSALH